MTKKASKKQNQEEVVEENVAANETVDETQNDVTEETTENSKESEVEEQDELSSEEKQIVELSAKVTDLNDKYLRLTAEYDNYRKRTLKERMELTKSAGESLLKGLLPVVDDFDRAVSHLNDASDLDAVKKGIDLIYNKFQEFLKQNGVKEIEAKEKDFDTDLHEAITKIPAPTEDLKGKVIDCIEKGYMLNDKVMRFSKVVVGE